MSAMEYKTVKGVPCLTCGSEAVGDKAHKAGFDYCRNCFYTGTAYAHVREAQLGEIRAMLGGGWNVALEHTGGGCFWLAMTPPDPRDGVFYIATDGEASLPSIGEDHKPIRGGWGAIARQSDDEDSEEYDGVYVHQTYDVPNYWDEYPKHSLSDAVMVAKVRADWEKRTS